MSKMCYTENEMYQLGTKIAHRLKPGDTIFLQGELGAGKTTLARAILKALGVPSHIKSPTYTIVEPYHIDQLYVYHFDLYRIKSPDDLMQMGLTDYFTRDAIILVEWPQKASLLFPEPTLICDIDFIENGRIINLLWAKRSSD